MAGAKTSDPIDFREQQGVYCLYDDNFRLVYVGQAGGAANQRLLVRLGHHRNDAVSDRWTKFSWFGVRRVIPSGKLKAEKDFARSGTEALLNHIEAILIAAAEPIHNRQGGRFGDTVEKYLQYRDVENLGPEPKDAIRQLLEVRRA